MNNDIVLDLSWVPNQLVLSQHFFVTTLVCIYLFCFILITRYIYYYYHSREEKHAILLLGFFWPLTVSMLLIFSLFHFIENYLSWIFFPRPKDKE